MVTVSDGRIPPIVHEHTTPHQGKTHDDQQQVH
jgi:hypothetical protein